jgi:hypothetical protein
METEKLHKTQTGISSEFFVAAELARRGYNVTLTFGNTKAIDLLVEKKSKLIPVQVKGMQRTKSICWNLSIKNIREDVLYVLVNLHSDTLEQPEYFVFTGKEMKKNLKPTKSGRDYIDYYFVKRLGFQDNWNKLH